jgi:hypothetical protein
MKEMQKSKSVEEKINERREDLEALAETDLPCADLAATLLEVTNG